MKSMVTGFPGYHDDYVNPLMMPKDLTVTGFFRDVFAREQKRAPKPQGVAVKSVSPFSEKMWRQKAECGAGG